MKSHRERRALSFVEKVTLFVAGVDKHHAAALLHGFAAPQRELALRFHEEVRGWESSRRQARLAHEFGPKHDADEKLLALAQSVHEPLRGAVVTLLPAKLAAQLPQKKQPEPSEVLQALAARLVHEHSR